MKFPGNSWGQQSSTLDLIVEGDSCLPTVVSWSESLWHPEVHWDTSRWEQRVWLGMLRLERYLQMKGLPRTRNCFLKEYRNWSRALAPLAGTRVAWLSNELVIHWSLVCASPKLWGCRYTLPCRVYVSVRNPNLGPESYTQELYLQSKLVRPFS